MSLGLTSPALGVVQLRKHLQGNPFEGRSSDWTLEVTIILENLMQVTQPVHHTRLINIVHTSMYMLYHANPPINLHPV